MAKKRAAYVLITPTRVRIYTSWAKREAVVERYARMFPEMVMPREPAMPWFCGTVTEGSWKPRPRIDGWVLVADYMR